MRTRLGLLSAFLSLSILAACGSDPESPSPLGTPLELSGVAADCPAGDISADLEAIFPTKRSLRHVATVNCGQIYKDLGKGRQKEAIQKAFKFFEKTLQQNEDGKLLDPDPSIEAKIIELFAAIFTDLGFDFPDDIDPEVLAEGEFAFGTIVPGGPPFLTGSKHAGIDDGGGLFGPVQVVIFQIGPAESSELSVASASHPCPAGVDDSFDCYPLFFDYSVVPESNVNPAVGLQLGQCNVSPSGVEVELLSPEGFLPEDAAPTGLDCSDVEEEITMTGWRSYAWAVFKPISPLFRVTSAFAGKNPVGGRISAFSPVAPADPESGGETPTGSISGTIFDGSTGVTTIAGATIYLYLDIEGILVAATISDSDGNYSFQDLDLGIYRLDSRVAGYEPATRGPGLTEEDPHAQNIDLFNEPELFLSTTELTPDDVVLSPSSSLEDTQLFTATISPSRLNQSSTVLFIVSKDNDVFWWFEADLVDDQAHMRVGCDTDVFGDIMVPLGNFSVKALHNDSFDVSTLSCGIGD